MYEDLVRDLRNDADWAEKSPDFTVPTILLYEMRKAADVIEKRDRYVLTLKHKMMAEAESHIALVERLNKQIEELSKLADAIPHVCECCIGCEVESGGCDNAFVLSPKRAMEYLSKRIEELELHYCPHAIRNVHDRGDDSLCCVLGAEPPKEEK